MFCIKCFHPKTSVVNSRPHKKSPSVWRRRKCAACHTIFTTDERPSLDGTPVSETHSDTHSYFNIGILTISIANAFLHDRDTGKQQAHWLARSVETWLATEHTQLTTHDIEAVTHQTLLRFDPLAAMQYAAQHRLISK